MNYKLEAQQILGCLIQKPQILGEVDKYSFILTDFPTRFERSIFLAIEGLYKNGAQTIQLIDIENSLKDNQVAATQFKQKNGIEYLQDAIELSDVNNFGSYYNRFKIYNLLNDLKKQGFDIGEFYCEDLTNPRYEEINSALDFSSPQQITDQIRRKLIGIETKYQVTDEVEIKSALSGIDDLVNSFGAATQIGIPIQGSIYNQVIDGAKKGTLTIRSAASSVGKTRNAVADACFLAYPIRYNSITESWEQQGSNKKVLFIMTEQRFEEIQAMILAYLTDISTSRFKYADFTDRERTRIEQAKGLMKIYQDNLILVKMPNPTIELIKTIVRENCLIYDIDFVFYDYIFIGPSLLNEFKGFALRNDEVLLMFATALKDLAVELDVGVFTSTQLNAKGDENKDIRNEGALAGGRSTINKADNGAIMARPTKEELEILAPLYENNLSDKPNLVTDIFKVRSGEWTQVRIWSIMDLGTLRKKDLFITDSQMEVVENFNQRAEYQIKSWEDHEDVHLKVMIDRLMGGEIIDKL